jgi:streptomycin 6-kinase
VVNIPDVVRNKALAVGAQRWIDGLDDLVSHLAALWSITVGRTYEDATEALVVEAEQEDGTRAVLKLLVPRPGEHTRNEITVLKVAGGNGCAELLRHDEELGALLLERLGPSLFQMGLPIERRLEVLCGAAEQVWRVAPECGLPTGAQKGQYLMEFITRLWEELDQPCSQRAVEHALRCAERRIAAHDDERAVLVHGDVHQWNALQSGDGFKLVDPDGLLAEPEYDLGILMREDPVELLSSDPSTRSRWLARRCGLNAIAIWEWGVVERVSTGLLCTQVGLQPVGREMLATADRVAE